MNGGGGGRLLRRFFANSHSLIGSLTLLHLACRIGGAAVYSWSFHTPYALFFVTTPSPPTTRATLDEERSASWVASRGVEPPPSSRGRSKRLSLSAAGATMDDDKAASAHGSATKTNNDVEGNDHPNRLLKLPSNQLRCRYFALRHGQSEANVQGLIASNPEVACSAYGLSALGREQAHKAGQDVINYCREHLSTSGNDQQRGGGTASARIVLLTSDLLRARQTAEAVRDAVRRQGDSHSSVTLYGDDVIVEARLRERGFGSWDLTSDDNYRWVWEDDARDSSHTVNGVESVDSVMRRVTSAVVEWDDRLCHEVAGSHSAAVPPTVVVCVAHGDVLQILQTAFQKMDGTLHRTLPHLETATLRPLVLKDTN